MLSLKDMIKEKRPDDKMTLNRLREFCKLFDDTTITHDVDDGRFSDFKVRCKGTDFILRLICDDGNIVDLGLMEFPDCDLFQPSFVSEVGENTNKDQGGLVDASTDRSTMQDPTSNIVEADPGPAAMPQEILTFVDDTATQKASLPEYTSPQASVLVPGSELRNHTIEDILKRPTKIQQLTWSTSQLKNTDIYTVAFPDAIIDASDIIKDKLQNFTYLRADICVRVIINASTFQQGKLLAYFAPFSRVVGTRGTLNEHLPAKTAFPHVVLDAATGNSGDLRIPFVNPYTHYNLTTQHGDMGNLQITVLNPLKTLTDCTVTVFAWFENIDLGVPTARPNQALPAARSVHKNHITTSDKDMLFRLIKKGVIRVKKNADTSGLLEFLTPYKSQCDDEITSLFERLEIMPKYKSQIAEDKEKSQKGIVTETLEHIGGAASGMTNLPLIGDVFKPVEWIANSASKVSALFGFSKPTSVETQCKFQNVPGFGFTHTDGLDQSVMLACKQDNQIQQRGDLFGSQVDEMDINYIAAHSCWFQTFKWTTADNPLNGVTLNEIAVHPGICPFDDENFQPTLTAFVSAPFRYWRGGLTYKVQVAKTSFHSGRIRIAYVPSGVLNQKYNLDTCYSWVLDLRTSDQIEFTIPYISNTQYKEVDLAPVASEPRTESTTGILVTEVLNALRAPDTVDQAVEINMWISGASDYQLAIPDFDRYRIGNGKEAASTVKNSLIPKKSTVVSTKETEKEVPDPVPDQTTQASHTAEQARKAVANLRMETERLAAEEERRKEYQKRLDEYYAYERASRQPRSTPDEDYDYSSGYESQVLGNFQDQGFNDFSDAAQMFGMKSTDQLTPKTLTIGEDVQNIRSLIKRFGLRGEAALTHRYNTFYVNNGFFGSPEELSVVALDYFSWIYRFYRGGQRYKFILDPRVCNDAIFYQTKGAEGKPEFQIQYMPKKEVPSINVSGAYNADPLPKVGEMNSSDTPVPEPYHRGTNFSHRPFTSLNPMIEVTLPFYANTPILPISSDDGLALADIRYNAVVLEYRGVRIEDVHYDGTGFVATPSTDTRCEIAYYTAAADDFSFGWLIGPPYLKENPPRPK
ncbi:hypothetical protein 2 [Wenzhou picorna-like virus 28]|uniref:hypothetical protein 2 n=1 Tax=Wenzhou picorna-like virus 28 TaxID=1923613 RepID=UPI00090B88A0|nr:hypothetical protein 2 [Wenzhou picorna-like virus 28]APG78530.1 hypothetical protein 2 [Wenzhou picorna-like virus 28]